MNNNESLIQFDEMRAEIEKIKTNLCEMRWTTKNLNYILYKVVHHLKHDRGEEL